VQKEDFFVKDKKNTPQVLARRALLVLLEQAVKPAAHTAASIHAMSFLIFILRPFLIALPCRSFRRPHGIR
jgi:hypothetical protein